MKTTLLFLMASFSFILIGCKGKTSESTVFEEGLTPIVLSLEKVHMVEGKEFLSSLKPVIEYVALETTDQSLISNVRKVTQLSNGNLLISDGQTINLFSPAGKYIRQISQRGNGPADYTRLTGLMSNPRTGGFFIGTLKKSIEFDSEGNYIRSFETEDRLMDVILEPDGNLLFHRMSVPKAPADTQPTWFIFRYDTMGVELKRFEDRSPRMGGEGIIPIVTPIRPMYVYNNKVRFNEIGNDTVFIVEKNELTPYMIMDLGEMRMSASPKGTQANMDAVFDDMKKRLFLGFLEEDDYFFYMTLGWGFGGDYLYATYNKKKGNLVNYGNGQFLYPGSGLINDVDGGPAFFPLKIEPDGTRIMWKTAESFRKEILESSDLAERKNKYADNFAKIHKLAESLDDDDNPVLMIVRSK